MCLRNEKIVGYLILLKKYCLRNFALQPPNTSYLDETNAYGHQRGRVVTYHERLRPVESHENFIA